MKYKGAKSSKKERQRLIWEEKDKKKSRKRRFHRPLYVRLIRNDLFLGSLVAVVIMVLISIIFYFNIQTIPTKEIHEVTIILDFDMRQ